MSSLTPVNNIVDGEDFEVQIINRPHNNLATRDEELLSLISATTGNVVSGYKDRVYIDYNNSSSVTMISGMKIGDDTGSVVMELTGNQNVTITSSGANGLDTGSPSTNWYHLYLIRGLGEGTEAGLISLSDSDPTMPSGYIYKRRIGAIRYSGGIVRYNQRNEDVFWTSPVTIYTGNPSSSFFNLDCSSYLPDGHAYMVHLGMKIRDTNGHQGTMYVNIGGFTGSSGGAYFVGGEVSNYKEHRVGQGMCLVDANGRFSTRDNGSVYHVDIQVHGYKINF